MQRTCRGCSMPITPGPRERNPKQWCSMNCRNRTQRAAGKYAETYAPRRAISYADCVECGELFVVRRGSRNGNVGLACRNSECAATKHRRKTAEWQQRYQQKNGAKYLNLGQRQGTCLRCGETFTARKGALYCSQPCWNAVIAEKYAESAGGRNRTRKMRERNAKVAPVSRKSIFERDRWRCYLCRKKINPTHKAPHPRSASIDHVIPLAHGGTHEPANVRTACLTCNISKGDRGGGEQLMLVG